MDLIVYAGRKVSKRL